MAGQKMAGQRMAVVGERRSYNGDICTIRFIGSIPDWSEPALGVEWDDPARGKHSGELHGVSYFECRIAGSGSFVKASREPDRNQSLDEALCDRYVSRHEISEPHISRSKTLQTVGAEKHLLRTSHVDKLQLVSLAGCCISRFQLAHQLTSLARLDLSNNLFDSIVDLCDILASMNVQSLNLSGNRFVPGGKPVNSVTELDLSRTLLGREETSQVLASFPNTTTLSLASNMLQMWPDIKVQRLDISDNLLCSIPELDLEELNVMGNPLVQMPVMRMHTLFIDTLPGGWADTVKLKCRDLRLGPPFGEQPVFIIGHCASLQAVNGTKITSQERTDAEIYTLRQAASGRHELDADRFAVLSSLYGTPAVRPFSRSILARQLRLAIEGTTFEIVNDAGVQRLIIMASQRLNKPLLGLALSFRGEHIRTGTVGDHFKGGESVELIYT